MHGSDHLLREQLRVAWEQIRQLENAAIIRDAVPSDDLAKELVGRTIKIDGPDLTPVKGNITFVDTGETVPGIRRIEITLDAQTGEMTARLYRWKTDDLTASLEHAETTNFEVSTLARVEEIHV